ncbi:MAG: molecular chaperone DnaJ [Candidatus Marinimicrobia bacterium]|nr:molecular chaperone DnaJ [Candidatus Neomarinimicrobiota bacterium]
MRDYYEILGVPKTSSKDEIKKAYRKVAMKFHPDRNPDNKEAEDKFKEAAEAYSVLSDDNKRSQYDQFGHAGVNNSRGGGFSGGMNVEDIFNSVFGGGSGGFSDIFGGDIFGSQRSSGNRRRKAENLKISIPLTYEEIFEGTSKKIKIKRWEKSSSDAQKCPTCNGTGEIRNVQRSMLGQIVNVQVCPNCKGMGYIGGRDKKTATIKVKIPAGVSDGNYMTLEGEGNHSLSGDSDLNGDLIIYFEEKPHSLFVRSDSDLYLECVINYSDAVLGTEVKVPTLNGKVKFKIPAGIKNGQILRLKNKGFKEVNGYGGRGDQYIKVNIDIPLNISKDLKKIILDLKNNLDDEIKFKKIEN